MVKPNFFLIGAPKCGTSSLSFFLSQHPHVFISNPKEPHFFEEEIPRGINSLGAYESLFKSVKKKHKVIGEASTGYLYSKTAIKKILSYSPDAKFLVAIRNPYEMVISLHGQALRGGYENIDDFSTAWKVQEKRRDGFNIPKSCVSKLLLMYSDRCALGCQLEKLYNTVKKERVFLAFLDDLKANPSQLYNEIYAFLDIQNDNRNNFPVKNEKYRNRWQFLSKAMRSLGLIKRSMGVYRSLGVANKLKRLAAKKTSEIASVQYDVLCDMDKQFIPQIQKIEKLSGRDLRHWYLFREDMCQDTNEEKKRL